MTAWCGEQRDAVEADHGARRLTGDRDPAELALKRGELALRLREFGRAERLLAILYRALHMLARLDVLAEVELRKGEVVVECGVWPRAQRGFVLRRRLGK